MEVERDRRKVVQRMKFEGVRYIAPGPPDMEHVIMALDDPMRIDRVTAGRADETQSQYLHGGMPCATNF